jgi:zinc transport system substrate-binding protein
MRIRLAVALWLAASLWPAAARAQSPNVVATIQPLHSLVAAVMDGVGTPVRLLPPSASPHTHALRPSEATALASADIVFWIGPALETFLDRPLASLAGGAIRVALAEADRVMLLPYRKVGFEYDQPRHEQDGRDPHLWLDPANARHITEIVAETLALTDPENAARYAANAGRAVANLDALETEIAALLAPAQGVAFLVLHDAFQYFEHRFGLSALGAVTAAPDRMPGARTLLAARNRIRKAGDACMFMEPQFPAALAAVVVEDTPVRVAVLDPLGIGLTEGPDGYLEMLRNLAKAVAGCLAPSS